MPRTKEIPEDLRKKVVDAYQSGKGYKAISKALGLHRTTVRAILSKWRKFGTVVNLKENNAESIWVRIMDKNSKGIIIGACYRPPNSRAK